MKYLIIPVTVLLLVACSTPEIAPIVQPTKLLVAATQAGTDAAATAPLSFDAAIYPDLKADFSSAIPPAGWSTLRKAAHAAAMCRLPLGSTKSVASARSLGMAPSLQIAIYQWEPVGDHAARLEMRRNNFLSSGNVILEETAVVFSRRRT